MKSLELNAYGVEEMSRQEMVETDGGSLLLGLAVAAVVAVVVSSCTFNYKPDNSTTITNNVSDSAKQTNVNVETNASVVPAKK